MKNVYKFKSILLLILLFLIVRIALVAQQADTKHYTVSGMVKDAKTKKKLDNVSVSVYQTDIATVTNTDGEFTIKIPTTSKVDFLEFSYIGYANQQIQISKNPTSGLTILMASNSKLLKEVVVEAQDPLELVKIASRKIATNYSQKNTMLTAFYRETVKKRSNYIGITEAIINVYKTDYEKQIGGDDVAVYKGRKLLSQNSGDTLGIKLEGGPNLSVHLDFVKNEDILLHIDLLNLYAFKMEEPVMIDNRYHYVVSLKPDAVVAYPLYEGRLYIDRQSLTFSRAELALNMNDLYTVANLILRKKPSKLRFKPQEVSMIVTYKQHDGTAVLNYIQNTIRFKCDWKRRLFSTGYTVLSEMVVTGIEEQNVMKIPNKERFKANQALIDKVSNFADPNFWEDYNIIEPTESLESAVGKLKKQYK